MSTGEPVTEQELDEVFREDPEFGLSILDSDFREYLWRFIKSIGWSFDSHDIADVYQEVQLNMIKLVRSNKLDLKRPILSLVKTIAKRRSVDLLRKKGHQPKEESDEVLEGLENELSTSNLGLRWRYLDSVIQQEFRVALMEEISMLAPKQRIVAEAKVNHLEESWNEIKEEVNRVTGQNNSVLAVKSAWRDAKAILVKKLTQRKFNFLESE